VGVAGGTGRRTKCVLGSLAPIQSSTQFSSTAWKRASLQREPADEHAVVVLARKIRNRSRVSASTASSKVEFDFQSNGAVAALSAPAVWTSLPSPARWYKR
jgi:hypothetical protein